MRISKLVDSKHNANSLSHFVSFFFFFFFFFFAFELKKHSFGSFILTRRSVLHQRMNQLMCIGSRDIKDYKSYIFVPGVTLAKRI